MNKQETRLTISVLCTLITGIALVYIFIQYHDNIFAIGCASLLFLAAAFLLTQNIITYSSMRSKSFHVHMKNYIDDISAQIEALNEVQSQLGKANYIYTKQTAQALASMDTNYTKSQSTLNKNLAALSSMQNKAAKLNIKYDQDNTAKVIATIKDLRNHLNETMTSGFDQIQPSNADVINVLTDIVNYLKAQSGGMNQGMELQLNNVAHELQNISHSIRTVQVPQQSVPFVMPAQQAAYQSVTPDPRMTGSRISGMNDGFSGIPEQDSLSSQTMSDIPGQDTASSQITADSFVQDMTGTTPEDAGNIPAENLPTNDLTTDQPVLEQAYDNVSAVPQDLPADPLEEQASLSEAENEPSLMEHADDALIQAELDDLMSGTEDEEEKNFKPTFTVIKNESAPAEPEPAPVPAPDVPDPADANKMLSPDEIAALFAASAPAEPEPAPAPAPDVPDPADTNKMLSPDEIAALFAASAPAEPEPAPAPAPDIPDPADANKMLSPDEIAALFAASAPAEPETAPAPAPEAPDPADANKMLSPDEIAALFAAMG